MLSLHLFSFDFHGSDFDPFWLSLCVCLRCLVKCVSDNALQTWHWIWSRFPFNPLAGCKVKWFNTSNKLFSFFSFLSFEPGCVLPSWVTQPHFKWLSFNLYCGFPLWLLFSKSSTTQALGVVQNHQRKQILDNNNKVWVLQRGLFAIMPRLCLI